MDILTIQIAGFFVFFILVTLLSKPFGEYRLFFLTLLAFFALTSIIIFSKNDSGDVMFLYVGLIALFSLATLIRTILKKIHP